MTDHPNILLIVVDCGRSDKWLGPGRATVTPNVDRLCREGVSFPTNITEKSCTTPSFTTLLTGLYSPRHGVHLVWGYRLGRDVPMLTHVLADEGYHTYAEVSGPLLPEMGLDRGFERYEYRAPCDYLHTAWGDRFVERLRFGHYRSPWFIMLHLWELHPERQVSGEFDSGRFGRNAYERAISSLDAQLARVFDAAGDDAFIVFTADHGEKTEAEQYRPGTAVPYACDLLGIDDAGGMAPFEVAKWAGPSVLQQLYGHCTPMMKDLRLRDVRDRPTYGRWTRIRDRIRLLRLTPMVYIHDLLALGTPLKLTEMLKRRGLLSEARARPKVERLVRAMGRDQLLDMHLRMWINSYKRNQLEGHMVHVYDFLVRVPLVMRWEGRLPAGLCSDRMIRQPDILLTVLDLIGADERAIGDVDGRSFRPLIEGQACESPTAYLSVSGLPADLEIRGVRTEEFKYTFGPQNPELPEELYDLRADPDEKRNLAAEHPKRCAELRELAESMRPADGDVPIEPVCVDADQQAHVEQHLKDLGYLA
ncbi:MAG: sulfatase-like hydrolase/transferase [Phycisphaerae bacterium]|nr:sulfatase-like hydrolase/transferase [Phycisphaerae bacterium]